MITSITQHKAIELTVSLHPLLYWPETQWYLLAHLYFFHLTLLRKSGFVEA